MADYYYTEMRPEHFEKCAELWSRTEGMGLLSDTRDSLEKYLERNKDMSFVCIERSANTMAGAILAGHDGRRGFIYHLAVDKGHRGFGIGKKLAELSTEAVKKEGIIRIILMVKTDNDGGDIFWKKLGWKPMDDLNMYSLDMREDNS